MTDLTSIAMISGTMLAAYGLIAVLRNRLSHNSRIEIRHDGVAIATVRSASADSSLPEQITRQLEQRGFIRPSRER